MGIVNSILIALFTKIKSEASCDLQKMKNVIKRTEEPLATIFGSRYYHNYPFRNRANVPCIVVNRNVSMDCLEGQA